jgi:hypothetical protein
MVKYKVEDGAQYQLPQLYSLYKYDSNDNPKRKKIKRNDVFVYRTTRHTERQKEGGCDWKVSVTFSFHLIL